MKVRISTAVRDRLLHLAAASPGQEVCGLLLGRNRAVEEIVEAKNVVDNPARTFEIDPRVQIAAAKFARSGGIPVIGCYHSHPSGIVEPSVRDTELAEAGSFWVIIGIGEMAAWQKTTTTFVPVALTLSD